MWNKDKPMISNNNNLMKRILVVLLTCVVWCGVYADEGMWMITNLSERTDSVLKSMGLELSRDEIFSTEHPALNNAIVQFGGFCSGVVVSSEGLVFTNHHCGYESIQSNSSMKHDYLKDGFYAKTYADELPNEGLYVDFHLNTYEVTDKMLAVVTNGMTETERALAMDSMATVLQDAVSDSVLAIHAEVVPYYKGSKYYISIYQRFSDVRLVCAPPQCLGKHGGDTDNWMWPRQTCDFSVFRVYAGRDNRPAEYSKDNVPYHPVRYATVSTQGYVPGSYCMTFGYPGSTDRYLSSYGIDNTMRTTNALRIQVREIKLGILREAMNSSDALRIMYASKYAQCSNYYKFSIGQNKALEDLGVIAEKQVLEKEVTDWAKQELAACPMACGEGVHECERCQRLMSYTTMLDTLKRAYAENFDRNFAQELWKEAIYGGSDVLKFAMMQLIRVLQEDGKVEDFDKVVEKAYKDIDLDTDKRLLKAMLVNYLVNVPDTAYVPRQFWGSLGSKSETEIYGTIADVVDSLYEASIFFHPEELAKKKGIGELIEDPMMELAFGMIEVLYKTYGDDSTNRYEQLLGDAIREMNRDKEYYPDANFTLRMSFGIVEGYNDYECFTPSQSIIDKYEKQGENPDYELTAPVYKWLKKGKWGSRYVDSRSNDLQLCFLTNNDITGGNSGSGMFDGKGRLIGLAFDGNWEAMSSDLKFDTKLTRCIGVDIRYVLSVIENYEKGKRLINELTLE